MTKHQTQIRWTHTEGRVGRTWNPIRGCLAVSPGCDHCYAAEIAARFGTTKTFEGFAKRAPSGNAYFTGKVITLPHKLREPLSWKEPSLIFTCSMADLFHPSVPFGFLDQMFDVMEQTPQHTYQVLTKRPERMREYVTTWAQERDYQRGGDMFSLHQPTLDAVMPPNIWLGTSIEDQARADERIPILLETPAAVRFLSCEPLLGPIDLSSWLRAYEPYYGNGGVAWMRGPLNRGLHWIIAGGESGKQRREMDLDWARSLRDQCAAAGVAFYFKQKSARRSEFDPVLDGLRWEQYPDQPIDAQIPTPAYEACREVAFV